MQVSKTPVELGADSRLALLIRIGGLNNDAEIQAEKSEDGDVRWKAIGNPTEAALLALYRKSGISERSLLDFQMVQNYPFDSRLKRMTRVFTHPAGGYIAFVKGATDVLLSRCSRVGSLKTSQKLTPKRAKAISKYAGEFAAGGYRVLSLAFRQLPKLPKASGAAEREKIEANLTFVGFVCILDPPREGVREAVLECTNAGIKTVMVTGDSAATACTVGRQLEIVREDDLISEGKEATELSDDKFQRTSVFARVDPDDKQVIVQRYKDKERAVAVTGDGVNDALALSISDVGIAMGITGTDVAKEASDMIIADDSFTSIVEGIRQGRSLFNKIRMMIFFYVAINLAESILFFGTFLARITFLTEWQHIFLTISSHTWPGLALVFDRPAKDAMQERPRNTEAIINRQLAGYLILNAILISIGVAIAYFFTWGSILPGSTYLIPFSDDAFQKAQMMAITVLLFAETFMILSIRRINQPLTRSIRRESYWLIYALVGLVFLMHWGLMYVPLMYPIDVPFGGLLGYILGLFEYVTLNAFDWLIAFALALPAIVGMELVKWGSRKRGITY
ncbi:MAG: HAD-IC family P-type ATPase, partial [Promethearchaeota archaeon]